MGRRDRVDNPSVTSIKETTKTSKSKSEQLNIRINGHDSDAFKVMIEKIQSEMPNKQITKTQIIKAFFYLNEDKETIKKVCKSLKENI